MLFIPDLAVLLQFSIATIIIAITPGPDMTLFVGRALSQGRRAGFFCLAGAISGIVVHSTLVALGLSALLLASPTAFMVLKIAGAGYLVWLAWQALCHGSAFNPDADPEEPASDFKNWATGLGINLLNPKIILFFMTFLPQFVTLTDAYATQKLLFLGFLFIVVALPISIPMVWAADKFAHLLRKSPRIMRIIDYVFAGVFTAFAVKILTAQVR